MLFLSLRRPLIAEHEKGHPRQLAITRMANLIDHFPTEIQLSPDKILWVLFNISPFTKLIRLCLWRAR